MARLFALATYAVKVWNPEEREGETLSDFGDESDLLDFFYEFLSGLQKKTSRDTEDQQVLRVEHLKKHDRQIYGIIETGEYGHESVLWDVDAETVAYKRKTTEANMLPFFFLVDIPEGTDEGILLLQRTGLYGIRRMLYHALKQRFDEKFGDFSLRLHPLVDSEEIQKYQHGKIESIRFIRFDIPSDVTDCFDSGHKEGIGHAELVIHAKRGGSLPISGRLREFFAGRRPLSKLIALHETNFDYRDIKVKSRVGRTSRTVDLARLNRLRSYYDITDEVELDPKSGHPKFDSIHQLSDALVERLNEKLYKTN